MIQASKYGQEEEELHLELTDAEKQIETKLKVRLLYIEVCWMA